MSEMPHPEAEEVLKAVDRLVAAASEPVYVALRLIQTNVQALSFGIAFMGTFTTKEAAFERCANNVKQATLDWELRGSRTDQWETGWHKSNDYTIKFFVAEQEVNT